MKKLFSFLFALSAAITVSAHEADRAMLKIRLSDRTPIAVDVDGRYFNRQTTSLTLDGLRPGLHRVEVYSLEGYRSRPARIYTGTIRLEPSTVNIAVVDVYRRALRMRIRPIEQRDRAYDDNGNSESRNDNSNGDYDDHDGPYNYPHNNRNDNKGDDIYGDHDRSDHHDNNDRGNGEGFGSFPHGRKNDNSEYSPGNILAQREMKDLHNRVSSRMTDTDKESLMKSELENRGVSTDQVREMLRWLSFESTRLDFAKWAYSRVADRQNYRKLEDAFDFSASRKEFNDAIRGR